MSISPYLKKVLKPKTDYMLDVCMFIGPYQEFDVVAAQTAGVLLNSFRYCIGYFIGTRFEFDKFVEDINNLYHLCPISKTAWKVTYANNSCLQLLEIRDGKLFSPLAKGGAGAFFSVCPRVEILNRQLFSKVLGILHQKPWSHWTDSPYRLILGSKQRILPEWTYSIFLADPPPNYRCVFCPKIDYYQFDKSIVTELDNVEPFDIEKAAKEQNPGEYDEKGRQSYFNRKKYIEAHPRQKRPYRKSNKRKISIKIKGDVDS